MSTFKGGNSSQSQTKPVVNGNREFQGRNSDGTGHPNGPVAVRIENSAQEINPRDVVDSSERSNNSVDGHNPSVEDGGEVLDIREYFNSTDTNSVNEDGVNGERTGEEIVVTGGSLSGEKVHQLPTIGEGVNDVVGEGGGEYISVTGGADDKAIDNNGEKGLKYGFKSESGKKEHNVGVQGGVQSQDSAQGQEYGNTNDVSDTISIEGDNGTENNLLNGQTMSDDYQTTSGSGKSVKTALGNDDGGNDAVSTSSGKGKIYNFPKAGAFDNESDKTGTPDAFGVLKNDSGNREEILGGDQGNLELNQKGGVEEDKAILENLNEYRDLKNDLKEAQEVLRKKSELLSRLRQQADDLQGKVDLLGIGAEQADTLQAEIREAEMAVQGAEQEVQNIQEKISNFKETANQEKKQRGELMPDGWLRGLMSNGDTILDLATILIKQLEGDSVSDDEVEDLALTAYNKFRTGVLSKLMSATNNRAVTLGRWKEAVSGLSVGDELLVGIGETGVELKIPQVLKAVEGEVAIGNGATDDYDMPLAA